MCKIAISPKKTLGKWLFVVRTQKVRFFIFRAYPSSMKTTPANVNDLLVWFLGIVGFSFEIGVESIITCFLRPFI